MNSQGETPREEEQDKDPAPPTMPVSSFVRSFGPVRAESRQKFRWYGPVRVAEDTTKIS